MKFLATCYDSMLQKEYKLYQMNARQLQGRLLKQYGLPKVTLQLFNLDVSLQRNITDINSLRKKGLQVDKDNFRVQQIRETIQKIKHQRPLDALKQKGLSLGYELMPIAVFCKGAIESEDDEIELIDGFNRMFCMDEIAGRVN